MNKYKTKLQDLGLDEAIVETTFAPNKDDIDSQIEAAQKLAETMQGWSLQTSNAIANVDAQWRYWTDDFTEDAQELGDATSAVFGTLTTNADAMALRFDKLKNILSRATPWLNIADIQSNLAPKREDEPNEDYIDRSIKAYKELQKAIGYISQYLPGVWADKHIKDFNTQLNNIIPKIGTYTSSLKEYRDETRKVLEERADEVGGMDALRKQFEDHPLEFIASFNADLAKKGINEFVQAESYRSLPLVLEVEDKDFAGQKAEAEKLYNKLLEEAIAKAEAEKRKRELEEAAAKALERQKKALQESLTLVQKMGATYDKLEGKIGASSANIEVANRYRDDLIDSLSRAGVTDTSFVANMTFDAQGVISGLTRIADAVAKGSKEDVQAVIKEVQAQWRDNQIDLQFNANVDNLKSSIDDALSQYQMGKELSKLGLGNVLTEQLFGVQTMDISDLRKWLEVQKKLHTDSNGEIVKEYVKIFDDAEKKITELQNKETEERIERYASYLKKSVSERVRLEQEAAKKIAEVEATSEYTSAQKRSIKSNIQKETQEAIDKLAWKDFKSSGMYLDLFENLDQASEQAIDNMLAELEKMRNSLSNLPPEQLKEIINQMAKLREIKVEKAGFGGLIKNIREGVKAARELPELEKQLQDARDTQDSTKKQNEERQRQYDVAQKQYDVAVKTYGENSKEAQLAKNRLGIAEAYLILSNEEVENGEKQITNLSEQVRIAKLQKKLANSSISEMLSTASAVGDSISNLHDALTDVFGELPTGLEDAFIYAEGLFAGIGDFEKGFSDIMSGKVLSGAINTIAGLFRTIGGLFGIGLRDTRREREIERELEHIEELQRSYEKLEEAIDSAYSSSTYDQAQDDAIAALKAQNEALERAQAAERDKKKTDQDRIDEWEQQKLENLEKIAELERQAIEAYGGFGSDDNIKSAAEDFVSAWLDAFNETGNGLDALSDKMDDWLNNAVQKQLLLRLSEQYITPLLSQFDQMFEETSAGGREMTKAELDAWKKIYEKNSKEFDEKAKAYLQALDIKPTGAESELSGLQRGIEGVTETTAQALEALLNSMRYYVSDSNNLLRQFYMSFMSADETMNPMLYELKQHTTLLNAIHSLLNSTTKMTNNNGRALKVLMM